MGEIKIDIYGREATQIKYTTRENKVTFIGADLLEEEREPITLKSITKWESPFEDEEITIEEKKEILENILKEFNKEPPYKNWGIVVDMSDESNIVHYDELLPILKRLSNSKIYYVENDILKFTIRNFKDEVDIFKYNLIDNVPYIFYKYCELPKDELIKFKEEINKSKEIQYLLTEFAKWKVNEDIKNINQKKFNYGLYALEILLCETTKEQVKEITKKYIETAKEKNLSFEPFMKRNKELNKIINELQ